MEKVTVSMAVFLMDKTNGCGYEEKGGVEAKVRFFENDFENISKFADAFDSGHLEGEVVFRSGSFRGVVEILDVRKFVEDSFGWDCDKDDAVFAECTNAVLRIKEAMKNWKFEVAVRKSYLLRGTFAYLRIYW